MSEPTLEDRIDKLYSQARDFVEHEDDLVDRRLKWVITISGFLFAAYGATWIAWPQDVNLVEQSKGDYILASVLVAVHLSLAIFGCWNALSGAISIEAAHLAIRAVTRKYNNYIMANRNQILEERLQVWKLIGDRSTHLPGFVSSSTTPFGIAFVWLSIAVIEGVIGQRLLRVYWFSESLAPTIALAAIICTVIFLTTKIMIDFSESRKKIFTSGRVSWEIRKSGRFISKRSNVWISEVSFRKSFLKKKNIESNQVDH